eukprot:3308818-Lingulodinium_polyedra.AAC.1
MTGEEGGGIARPGSAAAAHDCRRRPTGPRGRPLGKRTAGARPAGAFRVLAGVLQSLPAGRG